MLHCFCIIDQSPELWEAEWLCVDVAGCKIIDVYKPPRSRFTPTTIPTFPRPSLYIGDFICQHVNWGYNKTSPDGTSLDSWATSNNLGLLYDPKEAASFSSHWCNVGTNPDLGFASFGQNNRLPDRRVLKTFPRSQHRPSLITRHQDSRFLPTAIRWSVGTSARLIGSTFALQVNPLRDCHLRTQQTSKRHTKNFVRACYPSPNNASHAAVARSSC